MKTKRSESMPEIIFAGKGFLSPKNSSETLKLLNPRQGRMRNLTIVRLQKENNEMREKLKEINDLLGRLIGQPRKKPEKVEKIEKVSKNLKNIEKDLEYYKKEYKKVKSRCDAVKDPMLLRSLEEDIEKKEKTVKDLEDSIKKLKIFIKSKEKTVNSLSTTEENYENFKQIQVYSEKVAFYQKKIKKCTDQSSQTIEALRKLQSKTQNLETQILTFTQELETLGLSPRDPMPPPRTEDLKAKSKKLLSISSQKTSKLKIFHLKIKSLSEILDHNKLTEESLHQKFESLQNSTRSNYSTLNNIIEKTSLSARSLKNPSVFNMIISSIKEP